MKRIVITLGVLALVINIAFAIPTVVETSSTGTTIKFTAKLSETLPAGYKVKIDYGNGKGFVAMTCSVLTCILSTTVLPQGFPYVPYRVGIYNASGMLQGQISQGTYGIFGVVTTAQSPFITTPTTPIATSDYSKISNSGTVLPDTAVLGNGPNDWACTKDNKTGLIWDLSSTKHTNVFPNEVGYGTNDNTDVFITNMNNQTLCGASNWRLPTKEELMALVICSDGKYNKLAKEESGYICTNYNTVSSPTINNTYFPNTITSFYGTSSQSTTDSIAVWGVYFNIGSTNFGDKRTQDYVRLVHDNKPTYTKISNTGATLPNSAVLGNASNDWACTKDNRTGLIWEVKTKDGGLRDMDNKYTNYPGDNSSTNADGFASEVNKQTLCGVANWRLPTKQELMALVNCSDGKYNVDRSCVNYENLSQPTINTTYFPNTKSYMFWTSSLDANLQNYKWFIYFGYGNISNSNTSGTYNLRLVHDSGSITTPGNTFVLTSL